MALTQVPIELSSTPGIVDNSNATAITIDSSENVGIGTSSPTTFSGFLTVHQKNASGNAIHLVETDGGVISQIIANDANSGEVFIGARSNHPMLFTTNDTERMRIDSSGNVTVKSAGELRIRDDGTFIKEDQGLQIGNTSGTGTTRPIRFFTESAERMRIDSDGNLLVGTTTAADVGNLTTAHLLEGGSSSAGTGVVGIYNNTGTASCPALVVLNRDSSTDTTNRFVQFYANVTSSGATAMGGIVGNGASNAQFASLSDAREKTNIESISGSLDKINALNPVEFDWIASGEHVNAGFVAQEVEQVFPEFVVENLASEGEEERKGLTGGMTGGIVAHLVKAIQEQQAIITALETRITQLENN
jgi:hypothetical protein